MRFYDDVWLEVLSFVGYGEMVKMGFEGFKRQFGHKSLLKYVEKDKQFYMYYNLIRDEFIRVIFRQIIDAYPDKSFFE